MEQATDSMKSFRVVLDNASKLVKAMVDTLDSAIRAIASFKVNITYVTNREQNYH